MADEPRYDRRSADRFLQVIERQLDDLRGRVDMLDRDGSRGHNVLAQRVRDSEERRSDLVKANEREHDAIRAELETAKRSISHLAGELEEVRMRLTAANLVDLRAKLDTLDSDVEKLEQARAGTTNLREAALRVVGPYAGFVGLLVTLYYAVKHG